MSALHHPDVPDAGLVEGECFIISDGMPVSDAESLSFLLAPDGGLYFPAGCKEYDGSLPYRYFQAAMGPCRITLKDNVNVPLPAKEFEASFLRTQPSIRRAPSGEKGKDTPILFFLPPDGAGISESFHADIFGSTEPLRISLTKEEMDAELAVHNRETGQNLRGDFIFPVAKDAFDITMNDMVGFVEGALAHGTPMFEDSETVAGIPLDYVETIAAQSDIGPEEFVFYRAPK